MDNLFHEIKDGWIVSGRTSDEGARIDTLKAYQILDTPEEDAFDSITELVAQNLGVEIVLISLVRQDDQWFKSCYGLNAKTTTRDESFCAHAIHSDEVMVVPDATKDDRFRENPLVTGDPQIRFYAGAPLIAKNGQRIGSLCAIDSNPIHDFNERDESFLRGMARLVMGEMELRQQRRELIALSKHKSEFLARMSHEIRTPMNGIMGAAALLNRADELGDNHQKYVQTIISSGKILTQVLNDILDFSKIEAGKIDIHKKSIQLKSSLLSIRNIFQPMAQDNGLSLKYLLDPDLPDFVVGDDARIQQILSNFLNNAIKFTDDGGIEITVKLLEELDQDEVLIEFAVIDTGIGLSEEDQKNIFNEFVQSREESKSYSKGSGLGLAIAKSLVELMNGEIGVDSELGEGSTFWFRLPMPVCDDTTYPRPECEQATQNTAQQIEQRRPDHIRALLAEDVETNQFIIADMMAEYGVEVEIAENGRVAVEMAKNNDYDIIFMDVQMPVMDGLQATRKIRARQQETGKSIPIITLSAQAMAHQRQEALDAGMDDFLPKPVEMEKLNEILQRWVSTGVGDVSDQDGIFSSDFLERIKQSDPAKASKMAEMTIREIQKRLDQISVAIADGDLAGAGEHAHAMKSVAGQVGADQLATYAKRLEMDTKNNQENADYMAFIDLMRHEFQSVKDLLHSYIE
jgi:signal transduction histidine kinase/CheY-like chemotaxis protein/HPt (histidine-containing phosphotransfer) domain-containing protein